MWDNVIYKRVSPVMSRRSLIVDINCLRSGVDCCNASCTNDGHLWRRCN